MNREISSSGTDKRIVKGTTIGVALLVLVAIGAGFAWLSTDTSRWIWPVTTDLLPVEQEFQTAVAADVKTVQPMAAAMEASQAALSAVEGKVASSTTSDSLPPEAPQSTFHLSSLLLVEGEASDFCPIGQRRAITDSHVTDHGATNPFIFIIWYEPESPETSSMGGIEIVQS